MNLRLLRLKGVLRLSAFCLGLGALQAQSVDATYGKLPLSFEANMGQADPSVKFLARGRGYAIALNGTEAVLTLRQDSGAAARQRRVGGSGQRRLPSATAQASVRIRVANSAPAALQNGAQLLPGKVNYFIGKDPSMWRTGIATYARVEQPGVYPGIDLVYYGDQHDLEFDFVVAPGADPNRIRLTYEGVDAMEVEAGGGLALHTKLGTIHQNSPVVYQEAGGIIRSVPAAHVIKGRNEVGFRVEGYDRSRPLVIDPTLSYGTLLGGGGSDFGDAIAVDASGNTYVCGLTSSLVSFPTTSGAYEPTSKEQDSYDAFVAKMNPTGTALVYASYLGGSSDQVAYAIAVDSAGNAYLGGSTISTDFPTTAGAFQTKSTDTCCEDAFVAKLNPTGSALLYSTFLAGSGDDEVFGLAVDSSGSAYVTGYTSSSDFPTTPGAFRTAIAGGEDAFVAKLNPTGTALAYSTLLGGSADEEGMAIALDASGNAYAVGYTKSTGFPATAGAYRSTATGGIDAFVVKVNPAGSALTYSALLGGTGDDVPWGVAVDSQGSAYVAGRTQSSNFPVTQGAYQTAYKAGNDIFVSKLNPAGSALTYSTFIGGGGSDNVFGIAADSRGYAYLTGITASADFPITTGALKSALTGMGDAFVCQLNDTGTALVYSTYLGGNADDDEGDAIALDASGNVYVAGSTSSTDFPTTSGAYQPSKKAYQDAFIVKLTGFGSAPPPVRTIKIISGNGQTGAAGTDLPSSLVVEVDDGSAPAQGATVTFVPVNATLSATTVATDASGRASTAVHLGSASGTATVTASAAGAAASVSFTETVLAAPPAAGQIAVTSGASFALPPVAPGMLVTIWSQTGSPDFTAATQHAPSLPLPTSMGGVSVKIRDASGTSRDVGLLDVTPKQLNVVLPDGTQGGNATITVTRSDTGASTGVVAIESVAPGLFSATSDGKGLAVGAAVRAAADGTQTVTNLSTWDASQNKMVSVPIDMGLDTDKVVLVVYATGVRGRTSLANVSVTVGGQNAVVDYAGAQGSFVGLDQLNIELPRSLRGMGTAAISLTADGKTANSLNVSMAALPPAPAISSVSPASGQLGQTIGNFTITGTNLTGGQVRWDVGSGLTLTNTAITATSINGTLAIASNAALGAHSLWIATSGGQSNQITFTVTPPPPSVTTQSGNTTLSPGESVTWTFTGTAMATVNQMTCTPGTGITIGPVTATATQAVVSIQVDSTAPLGTNTCNLSNSSGWKSGDYSLNVSTLRISNLRATITFPGTDFVFHLVFDYTDPTGAASSGPVDGLLHFQIPGRIQYTSFHNWTPTGRVPGATSGTMALDFDFTGYYGGPTTGTVEINVISAGRTSDTLSSTF